MICENKIYNLPYILCFVHLDKFLFDIYHKTNSDSWLRKVVVVVVVVALASDHGAAGVVGAS